MIIGFYVNTEKPNCEITFDTLYSLFAGKGVEIFVSATAELKNPAITLLSVDEMCQKADVIITLGGDGTILRVVPFVTKYDKAIVGINLGHVGFLTEFEKNNNLADVVDKILEKKYFTEERTLLEISVNNATYFALNEAVVGRGELSKLVAVDVSIGKEYFDTYYADGVIVATATGSTAYSLSAGGPIMAPNVDALIVNGICPHSIHHRALVISGDEEIELSNKMSKAWLMADGNNLAVLDKGTKVIIKKAQQSVRFLHVNSKSFFDRLNTKLNRRG